MDPLPHRVTIVAAVAFLLVGAVVTWPLPLHFQTHLTGPPTGDAGVYVWNAWLFRHQIVGLWQSPFWTTAVLPLDGPTNLALHNYTPFANLLALPLQPVAGVIGAFNVVYLLNIALCGLGMFLLAYRLTGRRAEAWLAGAMFAAAPFLVARGTTHFSLAAAAPLPFFAYFFDRAWSLSRRRDAAAAGITIGWAYYCDPYYAVYTVLIGAVLAADRVLSFRVTPATRASRATSRVVEVLALLVGGLVVAVSIAGGGSVNVGLAVSMRSLYTPMLLLTLLVVLRALLHVRVALHVDRLPARAGSLAAAAVLAAALVLAPQLHALGSLASSGGLVGAPVLWRSSAPGADLAAFFLPNPNHPLAPDALRAWLAAQPGRFEENVVSISFVAAAVIVAAWRFAGAGPRGGWLALTIFFAALTLGPFVSVAGQQTYVPTPWTFLRYVPVIGEARMPQRFGIVVFMGLTVLFARALTELGRKFPARRRAILAAIAAGLTVELLPAPRALVRVDVPDVYRTIARDPRPVRVLDLPFGVRDGLSSLGDFNASSLVHQTVHHKEIIGGYLSRVDEGTKRFYRAMPTLDVLMTLSAGGAPDGAAVDEARKAAAAFVRDARVGYVVIDTARASPALARFAAEALALERLGTDGSFVLYSTGQTPR
jgi:hypothetical protein